MALGNIYFAWVDPDETTFGPEHQRYDESVFSFALEHNEGDFATLELEVRRPRNTSGQPIGLLAPGRKIWAWFAFDCGSGLLKLFGRLVGVTSNVLPEVVSIRLIARPADYAAQKAALADSLRVLPNYDPVFVDEAKRDDPDAVLEGYSAIWHIDRETHAVTVSDILVGEDTSLSLAANEMDFQGLDMAPSGVPLTSVSLTAELTWTQLARGIVDLTSHIIRNWPSESGALVSSFTFGTDNWPQNGTSLGDGWEAVDSSTSESVAQPQVITDNHDSKTIYKWWDGVTTSLEVHQSQDRLDFYPPGSILLPRIITQDEMEQTLGVWESGLGETSGSRPVVSWQRQYAYTEQVVVLNQMVPKLSAAYDSDRKCTEIVNFILTADMQAILTEPGEDETLRVDDLRSVNLSEPIIAGDATSIPIGDTGRRSYITTDRGQQSLQYMIAVARAYLRKRSRAVEIEVGPHIGRFPEISLRKSVQVNDPRLPGGQAFGKIISYSLSLNGNDGKLERKVKIGCPIGRGGTVTTVDGDPVYVQVGYVHPGYQAYEGRTVLFDDSVGFTPPLFNPQDDGVDFLSNLTADDVIDQPIEVTFPPVDQRAALDRVVDMWTGIPFTNAASAEEAIKARAQAVDGVLRDNETQMRLRLKSMKGEFVSSYTILLTDMKIPTGFNLEAA